METNVRMGSRGQVRIPVDMLTRFQIHPGAEIILQKVPEGILIKRLK